MRDGPAVSVVMAVRNGARLLPDALASIAAQTVSVAEVIVVDGHSSDATGAIAEASGARVVAQRGATLADAYNTGLTEAIGSHIAFLSHDDVWAPGKTELQLALLGGDPSGAAAVGLVEHVLEGEKTPPGFRRSLLNGPVPGLIMETLLAPRRTFELVGPFRPEVSPADDTDWYARLADLGLRVLVAAEVVLTKRVTVDSTAHNNARQRQQLLQIVRESVGRKRSQGHHAGCSL